MRLVDTEELDFLSWNDGEHGTTFDDGVLWVLSKISELPTVEPERKNGTWIRDPKSNRWRCSECCSFALRTDYREECLSDYCSACGAYMKGEQNEQT